MSESRRQRLADFVDWAHQHITGDEKGEAQIFLDRLFQAFAQPGVKEVGAVYEKRIKRKQGTKQKGIVNLVCETACMSRQGRREMFYP